MTPFNLDQIEQVMKLMQKYQIDEYSSEYFSLKRTNAQPQPKKPRKPYTRKADKVKQEQEQDEEFLDQHTVPPMDEEPWMQIPDSSLDAFTINGKLS